MEIMAGRAVSRTTAQGAEAEPRHTVATLGTRHTEPVRHCSAEKQETNFSRNVSLHFNLCKNIVWLVKEIRFQVQKLCDAIGADNIFKPVKLKYFHFFQLPCTRIYLPYQFMKDDRNLLNSSADHN